MDELHAMTIAALKKQIGPLDKNGVSPADEEFVLKTISTLSGLLTVLA